MEPRLNAWCRSNPGASIPIPTGRSLRPVKNRGIFFLKMVFTQIYDSLRCNIQSSLPLLSITRRRSFAEYWKYFVARFNDVYAFGYNSTGSERIWMKFSELRVYCLELALTDFGRDPRRSESGRPCGSFHSYRWNQLSHSSGQQAAYEKGLCWTSAAYTE